MSLHCSSVLPRCVQYYIFFCRRRRWLPVLSLSLRVFQTMGAHPHKVLYPDLKHVFPVSRLTLLALLNPFIRPSAHDWILHSLCDIMDGAEMEEVPVSHVILSLWGVVWGWLKVLLVCGRRTSGTFSCALLSWEWGNCLHLWCPLLFCLLSSCLTLPVLSLYNTTHYQREVGQPKIWLPVGEAAPHSPLLLPALP